jgi:transcriptional regulator with XRE-family HTH domain
VDENENQQPIIDPAVEERLVDLFSRVMDAQTRFVHLREQRGLTRAEVADALSGSELSVAQIEDGNDFGLTTMARYVHALGGNLEIRAVFPDETVELLELPPSAADGGSSKTP